ncbi:hypothetical protein QR680_017780 [Steinernema hermaphroditum]|uniref:Chloride channel CLIC-like protein 1 n=1 Tax=Steinernema hermaphroditum TaxID=289476 RepID=A0AA39HH01_9BILA|nr:hypothetical protein QR680_017780 [Steinernema hermaphroditum]
MLRPIVICTIVLAVWAKTIDIDLNRHREERTNWKDPNDFLSQKKPEASAEQVALEGRLRSMDSMTKLMIRKFFERLHIDEKSSRDVSRRAVVSLSAENLATIRSYLESNNSHNQMTLREQVHTVLEDFFVAVELEEHIQGDVFIYDAASMSSHPIAIPLFAVAVLGAVIYIQRRLTLRLFLFGVFLFCFITACTLKFIRKHQEIVSEQMLRMHESSLSDACAPAGFFGDLLSVVKGLVLIKTKSECQKFHEDMLVSPLSQINPLEIMSEVLASFFAAPLTVFARHFNQFFNEYYADTPLHIFIIKTVMLVIGSAIFFFVLSGYRLKTLFATLEPGSAPVIQQISNALSEPVPAITITKEVRKVSSSSKALSPPKLAAISAPSTDYSSCSSSPEISKSEEANVSRRKVKNKHRPKPDESR